jgi:hypothetical protein
VKLDIEGSELRALEGLAGVLDGPEAPILLCECNAWCLRQQGTTAEALRRHLSARGYATYVRHGNGYAPLAVTAFHPATVLDLLAIPAAREAALRPTLAPRAALTDEELVLLLLQEGLSTEIPHRYYAARQIRVAPARLQADPRVRALRARLAEDGEAEVWDALGSTARPSAQSDPL